MIGSPAKMTLVAPDAFSFSARVAAWVGSVVRSSVYCSAVGDAMCDVAGPQLLGQRRRQLGRARAQGGSDVSLTTMNERCARVQGGVAGPDGVLAVELGDHVVDRLVQRGVGRGQVGPLVGRVVLDLAVGGRVAARPCTARAGGPAPPRRPWSRRGRRWRRRRESCWATVTASAWAATGSVSAPVALKGMRFTWRPYIS